ncbi:hypothetical protein BTO30_09620 [Domibacillus antri]|uniref:Core-binding (CB) domain-containing protein n=1 Tax=Domibacillus antri TaxID=1714264 RepID=A0A1Q8Q5K1_9BACI|nr:hypothetical protein [Domibacillus antri]OLN22551.1 hypothetical protein BTO30_09620 [Domibacillus antri]
MIDLQSVDERIEKSSVKNIKWFYRFREYIVNENKSGIQNYLSNIRLLYEFYNHKDIDTIQLSDIQDFLLRNANLNTINIDTNRIKVFFNFISNDGATLNFIIEDLKEFISTKKELDKEEKRGPLPLSIKEVIVLRQLLSQKEKYAFLFTFEMVYRYGLKSKELLSLYSKNYNIETKTFFINKELSVQVDEDIHNFIINHNVIPLKKFNVTGYIYRITEMGKIFGRELIHKDIYQTHINHFLPCPICHNKIQNNPTLWAILEFEEDNSQWLVCKACAMKGEL